MNDLFDQVLDLADQAWRAAGQLASGLAELVGTVRAPSDRIRRSDAAPAGPSTLGLPPVSPGMATTGDLELENTSLDWVDDLRLQGTALVGPGGESIAGHNLDITPAALDLEPRSTARVRLTLRVPPGTRRGRYVGLVEAAGLADVQALVTVSVI